MEYKSNSFYACLYVSAMGLEKFKKSIKCKIIDQDLEFMSNFRFITVEFIIYLCNLGFNRIAWDYFKISKIDKEFMEVENLPVSNWVPSW